MRRALFVIGLVALGLVSAQPHAQAATHQVRIEDNLFTPKVLEIEPGDTVAWNALRGGHTVTADDGRFDFHSDRVLDVGEQVSWKFDDEEVVRFYCKMHGGPGGQGMAGVIRVGDPPRPPIPQVPTVVVPDDAPSIGDAAAGARTGTEILIRPGVYREEVVAAVPGLVIRGLGDSPDDVVLRGDDVRDVGVTIAARGVRIENLTVTRFRSSAIAIGPVTGTVVQGSSLLHNGLYGIDARAPAGLTVRDNVITGHGIAGVGVRDCETCGARIEGGVIEENAAGVVAVSATGVVLRGASLRGNAVGVVLRDVAGGQVIGNTLNDNDSTDVWVAAVTAGPEPLPARAFRSTAAAATSSRRTPSPGTPTTWRSPVRSRPWSIEYGTTFSVRRPTPTLAGTASALLCASVATAAPRAAMPQPTLRRCRRPTTATSGRSARRTPS